MSFKIKHYTSLLDQHLDERVREVKKKQRLYVFLIIVIFLSGVWLIWYIGMKFQLVLDNTIVTPFGWYLSIIVPMVILAPLRIYFHYFKQAYAKFLIEKLIKILGSNFSYFNHLIKDIHNARVKKLGFATLHNRSTKDEKLVYTNTGKTITVSEYSFFRETRVSRNSYSVTPLNHLLIFKINGIKIGNDTSVSFDRELRKKFESILSQKNEYKNGYKMGIVVFALISLILSMLYSLEQMLIFYGIIGLLIIFMILSYIDFKVLKNRTHDSLKKLYASQTLSPELKTLFTDLFDGQAIFTEYEGNLYIAHYLNHNYLSAPLRRGIERTKQKIRKDLQLFFGVIEWMEKMG